MVSIVVPVYNAEKYLVKCVESLLSQTYQDIEIILVDDGSIDNSPTICDSFTDKRIKVIHKQNGGISSARNAGLEIAHGEWVTFIDNDDTVSPQWIERMLAACENNKDVMPICAFSRDPKLLGTEKKNLKDLIANKKYPISEYPTFYLNQLGGFVWNSLFSMDIIRTYKIQFNERKELGDINEDLIFDFQYIEYIKDIVFTGFIDYLWNINESNHSKTTGTKWYFEKYEEKFRLFHKWMVKKNISTKVKKEMATFHSFFLINSICNAKSYKELKIRVLSPSTQLCIKWADTSKESIKIIWLIEHKCILLLYILVRLLNLKRSIL